MIASHSSQTTCRSSSSSSFSHTQSLHDLDEFLLGPADLEAMPFEFGCDFASAFDDKHLEVDAPAVSVASEPLVRPREAKSSRSHKRKSDSSSSYQLSAPGASSIAPRCTGLKPFDLDQDGNSSSSTQIGRWTKKEHELFIEGLRLYGKSWKKISSLVVTRTLVQIRTHAQKYLQKQTKSAMKAAAAAAAAASGSGSSSGSVSKNRSRAESSQSDDAPWKPTRPATSSSLFHPIAFPEHNPSSSSVSASSSSPSFTSSSLFPIKKETAMSKLDQLLHDESQPSAIATTSDELYSSPTGPDDDLVQWLQHRHLPLLSTSNSPAPTKRRRVEATDASGWPIVNPMEALAAANGSLPPHHNSFFPSHSHLSGDFLPPLSAYASTSSSSGSHHNETTDFAFGNSWL